MHIKRSFWVLLTEEVHSKASTGHVFKENWLSHPLLLPSTKQKRKPMPIKGLEPVTLQLSLMLYWLSFLGTQVCHFYSEKIVRIQPAQHWLMAGGEVHTAQQDFTQVSQSAGGSGTLKVQDPKAGAQQQNPHGRNVSPSGSLCLP